MDVEAALQQGHKVGLEIVKAGRSDPATIKQHFLDFAHFVRQGVPGTFAQLLVARGLIDAIATLPPAQATPAQGVDDLPPTPGGPSASTHQEADSMDNALLALVRDFPESFEDITAAADAGTDPAQLRATLESRRDEAERVAALAAAEAERDEAREALAAAEAERDEAREALAAAEAERDELKALNPGQPDPGADNTPANPQRRRDMTGAERNAFIVEHGISSYQALPY